MTPCSYDPLQLAERQAADLAALRRKSSQSDQREQVGHALKLLEWIEYAEESMIKAENDYLVEYSEEMHGKLHDLYANWLRQFDELLQATRTKKLHGAQDDLPEIEALSSGEQRVRQWLQHQASIQQHTLPHAVLGDLARAANLSAGNRSPNATP